MPAIYHPGVVAIIPHYNVGSGRDAVNVTYWKTPVSPLTSTDLAAIQTAFNSAWQPQWITWASNTTSYTGCWVVDMSSSTGGQVTNVGYTPVVGNQSGGPVGDQVAGLLSLKGITRYRGGHSRLYIPGTDLSKVPDGRNVSGSGTGILVSMYGAAVTALGALGSASGGPLSPVIWHKKLSAGPNTIEDITVWVGQPIVATQRRRVRKVSRHRRHIGP